jgi:predicted metal-dependent hydrolase
LRPMDPGQLLLPLARDGNAVRAQLEKLTGRTISLTITDNTASMVSVVKKGDSIAVRLHRMFLSAGTDVMEELARFIKIRKGETPLLRNFVRDNSAAIRERIPRRMTVTTKGKHHDLRQIYDSINGEYFDGRVTTPVTWGSGSPKYAVRKRTLGSYSRHTNTLRINHVLDRKTVPRYFVEFVLYHEMLHADMGIRERSGRRMMHSKEFRRRERLFRHYERAMAWEKKRMS